MQFSFLLGLIGTITGIASLTILVLRYISERPKINIYQDSKNAGIYFPAKFEKDMYDSPYRLALFIRIENLSDKPNSILEFTLEIPGYDLLHSSSGTEALSEYTISKIADTTTYIPIGKYQLRPIFVLAAYEAKEGFVFFPFCPEIKNQSLKGILSIKTSRKTFKTKVNIEHS